MKNSKIISLILGSLSVDAVNLDRYWDGAYTTQQAPQQLRQQPQYYEADNVQYPTRGSLAQQSKLQTLKQRSRMRHQQRTAAREWDDEMLHNMGVIKTYTDNTPKPYENSETEFEHNDQTWREVAKVDADEVKAEGIALAKETQHNVDNVPHHTRSLPAQEVNVSSLMQRQQMAQRDDEAKYDHHYEQQSTILPYTQRDHAWNDPQLQKSNEKTWDKQTQDQTHGAYGPSLSQWGNTSYQTLSQNQEKLYEVMEQNKQLYEENLDLKRMNRDFEIYNSIAQTQANARYDHQFETKSLILPYVQRNHAWNFDEHDATNWKEYEHATPEATKDQVDIVSPHPWPMKDDASADAEPEDEFKKCQADAVAAFKVARSPDEKREAMKAGARCLGRRCDAIAKKDLQAAADAPAKKEVLEAQTACHIGSGTTDGAEEPVDKHPVQSVWHPKDLYGDDTRVPNSNGTDYNKVRTDPRIPIKSSMDTVVPPKPEQTDDDKEAKKVDEKVKRDAKDKIETDKHLEARKNGEGDAKKAGEKKEEKKDAKGDKKEAKAGEKKEEKKEAKGDAKEAKADEKKEAKGDAKAAKTEEKKEAKPEKKEEKKDAAKAADIPPELDPAAAKTAAVQQSPPTKHLPPCTGPITEPVQAAPVMSAEYTHAPNIPGKNAPPNDDQVRSSLNCYPPKPDPTLMPRQATTVVNTQVSNKVNDTPYKKASQTTQESPLKATPAPTKPAAQAVAVPVAKTIAVAEKDVKIPAWQTKI